MITHKKCPFCGDPCKGFSPSTVVHPKNRCILAGQGFDVEKWEIRPTENEINRTLKESVNTFESEVDWFHKELTRVSKEAYNLRITVSNLKMESIYNSMVDK